MFLWFNRVNRDGMILLNLVDSVNFSYGHLVACSQTIEKHI